MNQNTISFKFSRNNEHPPLQKKRKQKIKPDLFEEPKHYQFQFHLKQQAKKMKK